MTTVPDLRAPRTECTSRYYRTLTYQDVDRVPDVEFGYWPQTIRRWLDEGLPLELDEGERNSMFLGKLDRFFEFDAEDVGGLGIRMHMEPCFETEIIEQREGSVISRDGNGAIAERFESNSDDSSIPHFIEFPVKGPDDWASMKERYRLDDPGRVIPQDQIERVRQAAADGRMTGIWLCGPYGQLRNWMGFENLSLAFFLYPEMIHDMVEHWTEMAVRQLDALPDDIVIDHASWWEDMASKNGPFVSPMMFREVLQPCYHRIMAVARRHGCTLGIVDCDGNPHDLVANWLEEGVNIMFPLEVPAGVDPYAWREEFGMDLRLKGGIAKEPLVHGGKAIDDEIERIKPLLDQGGFIPHLDHLVPPDISYDNYRHYLDKKRKLIGK